MLDQILADPADDALRLVYADQLLAAGDTRGEYITVEARLAAAPRGSPERAALAWRRAELRQAHGAAWWPELPERRIGTRHGFAETIALYPIEVELLPRLARREPIRTLELLEYRAGSWLPRDPWPTQIRRLVVHSEREETLNSDALQGLWLSPLCDEIEELAVACQSYARWLPFGPHLPRCRRLCLAGSQLEDVAPGSPLRALRRWDPHARLEVLDVSHCRLAVTELRILLSLHLPALRVLRLSGNRIDDDGARVLASHMSKLPALERLELLDAGISARSAAMLRESTGSRVEIVLEAPPPSRLAIDALGIELELIRVDASGWVAEVDGARRPIRVVTHHGRRVTSQAPLGPLVHALATGAPRELVSDAISVAVGPHEEARLGIALDRSEVWFEPRAAPAIPDL
ncbi:MAG TPA: TIGR02996 domain-containing protein [Kofleriaceae bacterium]|nr:TIGR02996 domain-containing protein [Kofleriaceae bacterium]